MHVPVHLETISEHVENKLLQYYALYLLTVGYLTSDGLPGLCIWEA